MVAIEDSLSDLASTNNEEDREVEDDEGTEQGKVSKDDEPGNVMGTISKIVQQHPEWFQQHQMKPDKMTQPGWGDAADNFDERDEKYRTTALRVPAVIELQMDDGAATPITFGECMECFDIVPGISQMPQGTSHPGCSQMRVGSGKPQSNKGIMCLPPDAEPNSSPIQKAKHVEPVSLYPCILPPQQIIVEKSDLDEEMVIAPAMPEE